MATAHGISAANQPPPLAGYNLYRQDIALAEALVREGGAAWEPRAEAFGELLGGEPLEWGRLANEHPPTLRTHDRYGERVDEIEFHPAWDSLLRLGLDARLQSLPWLEREPGAHVARATLFMPSSRRSRSGIGRSSIGKLGAWPSRSTTAPSERAMTDGPRVSRPC